MQQNYFILLLHAAQLASSRHRLMSRSLAGADVREIADALRKAERECAACESVNARIHS